MKRFLYLALFVGLFAGVGCSDSDNSDPNANRRRRTLTFEDYSYGSGDIENPDGVVTTDWWKSRIDTPQYGGPLLYGGNGYSWYDSETDLFSALPDPWGDGTFYGGGIAISNYIANPTNPDYTQQLTTNIKSVAGRANTNFAVCYVGSNQVPPYIEFKYGVGTIEQLYIFNTEYPDHVVANGNDLGVQPMPDNGYIKLVMTGINKAGNKTGEVTTLLYEGRNGISTKRIDLRELGDIKRLEFRVIEGKIIDGLRVDSTAEYNEYPSYFAFDNVTVWR
ncbi:MAG: DUF4465 domain-containing protein [Alistipes sp.]|nr:DUF4465 domain-containing protein [Alistipes sp.]